MMKKILVLIIAILGLQIASSAQSKTSLGVRLGAGTEFGGELILGKEVIGISSAFSNSTVYP